MPRYKTTISRKSDRKNRAARNRNLLWMILAGLVVLISAAVFASQRGGETAGEIGPRLAVDQEVVDFGEVKLGETVTAQFKVTNTGDETLRFTREPYIEVLEGC